MSIIDRKIKTVQQFFRSGPMPCPYLPGRIERKLFTRMAGTDGPALNSILTQAGFRRSHDILYRPACGGCHACVPVRIPVTAFTPSRTQKRLLRRNADLIGQVGPVIASEAYFDLFRRYEAARHAESDMARMGHPEFTAMVEDGALNSMMVSYTDPAGSLVAVMMADRLDDGVSAVYSFFDPDQARRSLGTYVILDLIARTRARGLAHVYLGYWIAQSPKMAYKNNFKPLERLTQTGWIIDPADPDPKKN